MQACVGHRAPARQVVAYLCLAVTLVACGCRGGADTLTVYTALDEEFSAPVFEEFTSETGIRVRPRYDVEAAKTTGLVQLILEEHRRGVPRCDVFWNNEIIGTLRLLQAGALEPVSIQEAALFPEQFRSPEGYWYGFAARARILLCNTSQLQPDQMPRSVFELTDPQWRGRFAIANPLFGTTNTHMTCLFAVLGTDRAREWIEELWQNEPLVLPGNRHVAEAVASGRVPVGLTDTDDALGQIRRGAAVRIVFPDQDGLGTLLIPNSVAVVRGTRNPAGATALVGYLLSAKTEKRLALGPSGQIPLRRDLQDDPEIREAFAGEVLGKVRSMEVDFEQAAHQWETVNRFLEALTR